MIHHCILFDKADPSEFLRFSKEALVFLPKIYRAATLNSFQLI